ncbi:MAG: hypothetical protein JWM08_2663 [Candidatus Angelobacter sp.]|nr:hypothetical protein [Candidatus Angelobacter sp.]
MKLSRKTSIVSLFLAVILSVPAFAQSGAHSALPGALNYVEGQANIGPDSLNADSVGSTTLQPGQTLATGNGKVEILLTPGVFLRVDDNSAVSMISASITNTAVQLDKGRVMIEVAEIHDQNHMLIRQDGFETRLVKKGLYLFDADRQQMLVFAGKADVQDGGHTVSVNNGKRLDLNSPSELKTHEFDKENYKQNDLYQWSSLRSSYLAEANADTASDYVSSGYYGPGWVGDGWYWDPGFNGYTFIPGDGVFYSPFGFGFYSPLVVFRSPFFDRPFNHFGHPAFVGGFRPGFHGGAEFHGSPGFHGGPEFHGSHGFHNGSLAHGGGFAHGGGIGHGGGGGHR